MSDFSKIQLLATDFDGVMTNGYTYVNEDGVESVRCSRKDGLGLSMLTRAGIDVIVISKDVSRTIRARCDALGIPCYQGIVDSHAKVTKLKEIMKEKGLSKEQVAYVGDDLNDRKALEHVGLSITVADGHPILKSICSFVTEAKGGCHALREIAEHILNAKGIPLEH